ncbi:RAC family serine/threonine-protein kinase like protein [Tritrichomonas foetus]|uniref:RAC family serine/threonine-protein kinase like protein n=1 Tax=Tritrichomonas foetus TaxID=1144522 RepID=A0A1J4KVC4_9EUKA|nr:RAC family serine/threonine-protein kinase like protein [Tritrichomonas foetus]|eukprot:OHT14848.1 RAC family serine/threonine-protein kinase like protein [Tritrichomonas foetus]
MNSSDFDFHQNLELLFPPDEWRQCFVNLKGKQMLVRLTTSNQTTDTQNECTNENPNNVSEINAETAESSNLAFTLNPSYKVHLSKLYENSFVFRTPDTNYTFRCPSNSYMISWIMSIRAHTSVHAPMNIRMFRPIRNLGRGKYGKVKLCQKIDTNEIFAIKAIKKNLLVQSDRLHTVITEKNILRHVSYPFIVNLYYAFQSRSKFFLCLEYAPGGDLFNRIKQHICFDDIRLYIAEISLALHYLHGINFIYRDLKPENVLFDRDGHIKLTDFGLSKDLGNEEKTSTFCGTTEYLAPEIVKHDPYSYKVDWWTLGILVFEMFFKRTPFFAINPARILQKITLGRYVVPNHPNMYVNSFIDGLLQQDPARRFGFNEVKNHPFMEGIDFNKVLNKEYYPTYIPPNTEKLAERSESGDLGFVGDTSDITNITDINDMADTVPIPDDNTPNSYDDMNIQGFSYNYETCIAAASPPHHHAFPT